MGNEQLSTYRYWSEVVDKQAETLGKQLSAEERSALCAGIYDTLEGFSKLIEKLLPQLDNLPLSDREALEDLLWEIASEYKHIEVHVKDMIPIFGKLVGFPPMLFEKDGRVDKDSTNEGLDGK